MDTPTPNILPGCFGGFFERRVRKKTPTHASALQGSSQGLSHGGSLETTRAAEKKVGGCFLERGGFPDHERCIIGGSILQRISRLLLRKSG